MTTKSTSSPKPCKLTWRSTALCLVLTKAVSAAAVDVTEPHITRADQDLGALLRKIEDQVSAGHAISPADDNGMETWRAVLRVAASGDQAQVRGALTGFIEHMRNRASAEKAAGKQVLSSDLTLFAEQANRLLKNANAASPGEVATPRAAEKPGGDVPLSAGPIGSPAGTPGETAPPKAPRRQVVRHHNPAPAVATAAPVITPPPPPRPSFMARIFDWIRGHPDTR